MERRSFLARCVSAAAACVCLGAAVRPKRWETAMDASVRPEHIRLWLRDVAAYNSEIVCLRPRFLPVRDPLSETQREHLRQMVLASYRNGFRQPKMILPGRMEYARPIDGPR